MPRLILDYMQLFPAKRRAFLAYGVTPVRSLGDDYGWVMEMRRMLLEGELEGPRRYAAGPLFTAPRGHPIVTIGVDPESDGVRTPATSDEARQVVADLAVGDDRIDLIKAVQERGRPVSPLEPIALAVFGSGDDPSRDHTARAPRRRRPAWSAIVRFVCRVGRGCLSHGACTFRNASRQRDSASP